MEWMKMVIGYGDGSVLEGVTQDLHSGNDRSHLHPMPRGLSCRWRSSQRKNLEVVFFVDDATWDPETFDGLPPA